MLPRDKVTENEVSAPATPGSTLVSLQPSLVESRDANSRTVMLPSNLNDSASGADWMSMRLGLRAELVLVNSALPRGWPVFVVQLRSRNGCSSVPFRYSM